MSHTALNELSLFQSNISLIQEKSTCNVNNDTPSGASIDENVILCRLNELRLWQQSQQQMLIHNQTNQRELLQLEKQKLYQMFGLSLNSEQDDDTTEEDEENAESEAIDEHEKKNNSEMNDQEYKIPKAQDICKFVSPLAKNSPPTPLNINKIVQNMAIRPKSTLIDDLQPANENLIKRPFLKRGEGLTNRFKIAPDAFRLDNLPKYKFARKTRALPKQKQYRHHDKINDTASAVVAGEGHQNNVLKPSQKEPNIKCSSKITKKIDASIKSIGKAPATLKLKSKIREQSSTNNNRSRQSKDLFNNPEDTTLTADFNKDHNENLVRRQASVKTDIGANLLTPTTKILLDTPIRNKVQKQQNEINELEYFERLEENLADASLRRLSEISSVNSIMAKDRMDENVLLQFKLGLNLVPKPVNSNSGTIESEHSFCSDNAEESKHVHFAVDHTNIENNNHNSNSESALNIDNDKCETNAGQLDDTTQITSSPNERSTESFRKFKEKLFDRKLKQKFKTQLSVAKNYEFPDFNSDKDDDDLSIVSGVEPMPILHAGYDQPVEKLHEMQERLRDLEMEIKSFREQNNELTKLIREHEMIRIAFDEERQAAQEQIDDERVKFEMYMHDERMKLLNERTELDRRTKELQRPNRSERDEIIRLREQCLNHEKESTAKDQKHVTAQARIRAQLRTIEKDFKELQLEAENLRRENKKLETENVRLRRQSNNKMLMEINRNIAKLAPLNSSSENAVNNNNDIDDNKGKRIKQGVKECSNKSAHKTVVAKVTSHRTSKSHHIRSKSVPNLQQAEKMSHSTGTSPNSSDAENIYSDDEANDKSAYFGGKSHTNHVTNNENVSNSLQLQNPLNEMQHMENTSNSSLKRVIENPDGSKDVWYPNGNLKKISADAMIIKMLYYNKDIKETNVHEGIVKYYYADTNTWHTTYVDGMEILEFPTGQTEHRYKDGTVEIHFPNGSVRVTNPLKEKNDGIAEEWKYPDGTNVIQKTNGERLLFLPNGQREVHTNGHKRREYPDGTVKIVYPDGSQESRYSNGRVRLKDKDGKLIMDSETIFV